MIDKIIFLKICDQVKPKGALPHPTPVTTTQRLPEP
jgi:hypothetical protein